VSSFWTSEGCGIRVTWICCDSLGHIHRGSFRRSHIGSVGIWARTVEAGLVDPMLMFSTSSSSSFSSILVFSSSSRRTASLSPSRRIRGGRLSPPLSPRSMQLTQQQRRAAARRLMPTAFLGVAVFFATTIVFATHLRYSLHDEVGLLRREPSSAFQPPHRRLRSPEHNKNKPLQILSFYVGAEGQEEQYRDRDVLTSTTKTTTSATSSSYAEMLSDRTISDAYHSMDLAVACTQSIVGDAVEYDAITLPLLVDSSTSSANDHPSDNNNNGKWVDHNRVLVDRVRKRFPNAVIVLVELLPLTALMLSPTGESYQQWYDRRRTTSVSTSSSDGGVLGSIKERARAMIDDAAKVQGNWIWANAGDEDKRLLERRRNDPLLVTYWLEPTFHNLADAIDFLNLFSSSSSDSIAQNDDVLSKSGHVKVANDIRSLIQSTLERTVVVRKDREAAAQLKSWGTGDDCHLWLTSGDYLPSTASPLELPQRKGPPSIWHKHALEFRKQHNDSLSIYNPFPTDRMLFLTYMADIDSMDFSTTRVFVNGVPTVQIQPFHDHTDQDHDGLHVARTAAVGLVPPGASTVVLEPVTQGLPFWLVGASILAQEALELPVVEFDIEREHLVDMNYESSRLQRR
jgi:hypothetical protein